MRREPTATEAKLWRALRAGGLSGLKVRRQVPLGPFILDFAVVSCGLVIEVDGDSHVERPVYDDERTAWFAARGWKVVRFANSEVLTNLEGVLGRLLRVAFPHPDPLPMGEGA